MITEALKYLDELATARRAVKFHRCPGEPEHVFYLQHGDQLTRKIAEADALEVQLASPAALANWLDWFEGWAASEHEKTDPALFVSARGLEFYQNLATRRELAFVTLKETLVMQQLRAGFFERLEQLEFVDKLRELRRYGATSLLAAVKNLTFVSREESRGVVDATAESFGFDVDRHVTGADAIPETITLSAVPVYDNFPDFNQTIECDIVVHLKEKRLSLRLAPGELSRIEREAVATFRTFFDDSSRTIPIFEGRINQE